MKNICLILKVSVVSVIFIICLSKFGITEQLKDEIKADQNIIGEKNTIESKYQIPFVSFGKGVYVINTDSSSKAMLADDPMAVFVSLSPDWKKVAFESISEEDMKIARNISMHFFVYIINLDGKNRKRLMDVPVSMFNWAPDGNKIVFISSYEDEKNYNTDGFITSAIYVVDSNGENIKRLTAIDSINCSASWSPDSQHIVFCSNRDGKSKIYIMNSDGSEQIKLIDDLIVYNPPIFSPDGKKIVFSSDVGGKIPSQANLYIIDSDGRNQAKITDNASYDVPRCWTKDNKRIVFTSGDDLCLVDINGKNKNNIVDSTEIGRVNEVMLLPDNEKIVLRTYKDNQSGIYILNTDGTNLTKIVDNN